MRNLTIAIGDVHGCDELLTKLLAAIESCYEGDSYKIVFLGDYVDRGPNSARALDIVDDLVTADPDRYIALFGNHEHMMYDSLVDDDSQWSETWVSNGGGATMMSYDKVGRSVESSISQLENLKMCHIDAHRIYIHAYADRFLVDLVESAGLPVLSEFRKKPELSRFVWSRYMGKPVRGVGHHIVHGHTPHEVPEFLDYRTNIDTGAVFGYYLSAAVFDDSIPGGPVESFGIKEGESLVHVWKNAN